MPIDCCNCCNTRGKANVAPAAAFSAGGLPASLLADLFLWYKFDGLPGETFVTDYSGNDRHGTMAKNTQSLDYATESLNPTTWGLKWGPAPGVGTVGSAVHFTAPDSLPSPNLLSVFFVLNPYGAGNFNFSSFLNVIRVSDAHDANYRPFRFLLSRANIGAPVVNAPNGFSSNTRGTGSLIANAITETGSIAAGADAAFSADRWRLVNYKRQGAGTTNHHFRINRKVQTLVTAAGDYVAATPLVPTSTWRLGNESSASGGFYVGYQSWLMIFNRNLTSPEELLVEDYIYGQMASRGIFLVDLP